VHSRDDRHWQLLQLPEQVAEFGLLGRTGEFGDVGAGKKVLPSQTSTTASIPARARMSATAANRPSRTGAEMVFTGGLSTQ